MELDINYCMENYDEEDNSDTKEQPNVHKLEVRSARKCTRSLKHETYHQYLKTHFPFQIYFFIGDSLKFQYLNNGTKVLKLNTLVNNQI